MLTYRTTTPTVTVTGELVMDIDWRAFFKALWTTGTYPRLVLELHYLANIMPSLL